MAEDIKTEIVAESFNKSIWLEPLEEIYSEIGRISCRQLPSGKILVENILETAEGDSKIIPVREYDTYAEANAFCDGLNFYWEYHKTGIPALD